MEDATIIEQDTSNIQPEVTQDTTVVEQPTVVEQVTPMDANTTYDNLQQNDITYDPTKDVTQNLVQDAMHISHDENVIATSGSAMNRFLTKDYDYDREEAGSYWVAGGINDKDTQMSFLNTIINEEMYDEMDLQKYYYDSTLATARAYAAQKEKETAYGYYRAAQEKAIAEAQLTGWYMPAEGQYMLANYEAAQTILNDPNADDASKAKANRISGVAEQWFAANKISTRGMKCLNMMNYEENVRHNKIMGELQKQANQIAASQAGASAAGAALQLRQLKFQVEEMELQSGHNYSKEIGLDNTNTLGHDITEDEYADFQALQGFKEKTWRETEVQEFGNHDFTPQQLDDYIKGMEEDGWKFDEDKMEFTREVTKSSKPIDQLLSNPDYYSAILTARGKSWVNDTLKQRGKDPQEYYNKYQADLGDTGLKESYKNNGNILDESYLNAETWTISESGDRSDGKKVYTFHSTDDGKPVTRCYWKDDNGVFHQITSKYTSIDGHNTIEKVVSNFTSKKLEYNGEGINVGNKFNRSDFAGAYSRGSYYNISAKQTKTIAEKEQQGYKVVNGGMSTKKLNTSIIMQDADGKYYEVENDGKFQELTDKSATRFITVKGSEGDTIVSYYDKGNGNKRMTETGWGTIVKEKDLNGDSHSTVVHVESVLDKAKNLSNNVFAYTNPDGSIVYMEKETTRDGYSFKIISQTKAEEITKQNLSHLSTDAKHYQAGYIETTSGKNQDTMESEATQKYREEHKDDDKQSSTSSGGGSSASGPRNIPDETQNTADSEQVEYQEYVSRMEKDGIPKAEILPFNDWRKEKATINDMMGGNK